MDPNNDGKPPSPHPLHHRHHHNGGGGGHHHHYHYFYVSPHCPRHRPLLQPRNHSSSCSFSTAYPYPQNPEPFPTIPTDHQSSYVNTHPNHSFDDSQMIHTENENLEAEEEEEGDPIFVLTDEWRDFFAKSEAKRREAKNQAKKGKK